MKSGTKDSKNYSNNLEETFNLFSVFSLNQREQDQSQKKFEEVKELMKLCEKYSSVLSSQEDFNKELQNQDKFNSKKEIQVKDVFSAIAKSNISALKSLNFIQEDLKKAQKLTEKITDISEDSFAKFSKQFLDLENKPKKIELLPDLEIETFVPVIETFGFVDIDNFDKDKFYMGRIDNSLGLYPIDQTEIPVASFKLVETFNKEKNKNVPVNVRLKLKQTTLKEIIEANIIKNVISSSNKTDRIGAVAEQLYSKELSGVKQAQMNLLSLKKSFYNEEKRLENINVDIDELNTKIKALSSNGRPTEKYQEKLNFLLSKQQITQDFLDKIQKTIEKSKAIVEKRTKEVVIDQDDFSQKLLKACKMEFERDIVAEIKAWADSYGKDVETILDRKIYLSPVDKKHYILPIGTKDENGSVSLNYNLCPTIEDDLQGTNLKLSLFDIDEKDSNIVAYQDKIFQSLISACPDIDFISDKEAKEFKYYDRTNKMIVPFVIEDGGKTRKVFGIEQSIKSLEKIIESKYPKKLINKENARVLEVSKLRALEFIARGIPGLGNENANKISTEIQKEIVKKAILINDLNKKADSVSHSTSVAGELVKSALIEVGMEASDAVKLHNENGFYYTPIKPSNHKIKDWINCPASVDKSLAGKIEISNIDCLKIQRLANFTKFEAFEKNINQYISKITPEDIEFQTKNDGAVRLAQLVNNQLNNLTQFSAKKRQPASAQKILTKACAQVLAILKADKKGAILSLIDRNINNGNIDASATKKITKTLDQIENVIDERLTQDKNKAVYKTEKDVTYDIDGMLCVKTAIEEKDEAWYIASINKQTEVLANKLDFFLKSSNVGVEMVNLAKGCETFSQDVKTQNSQLTKTIQNISRQDGSLSELPQAVMRFISFTKSGSSLINRKDTVRNIINGIVETGFPKQYQQIRESVEGGKLKTVKQIAELSKSTENEVLEKVAMEFSGAELGNNIAILNSRDAVKKFADKSFEALAELKELYANKKEVSEEQLNSAYDKLYSIDFNVDEIIKKNFKLD